MFNLFIQFLFSCTPAFVHCSSSPAYFAARCLLTSVHYELRCRKTAQCVRFSNAFCSDAFTCNCKSAVSSPLLRWYAKQVNWSGNVTCILKVSGSNFGRYTGCADSVYSWFSVPLGEWRICDCNELWPTVDDIIMNVSMIIMNWELQGCQYDYGWWWLQIWLHWILDGTVYTSLVYFDDNLWLKCGGFWWYWL